MRSWKSRLKSVVPWPLVLLVRRLRGHWRSRKYADRTTAEQLLGQVDDVWRWRISEARACPDNAHIPRVAGAGTLENGLVTMHNGLRVSALGYYGGGNLNLLVENQGVHEPQEERAFAEVLKEMPAGATMLELGAYWGFYSLWFATTVPGARNYLIEPEPENLVSARENFRFNGATARYDSAYIGAAPGRADNGTPILSVDAYCEQQGIDHLAILHADIQGFEREMIQGAQRMLSNGRCDYVFLSTHSNDLHQQCVTALEGLGYHILASANLDDTYSVDGLIVARFGAVAGPDRLEISHKSVACDPPAGR